MIHSSLDSDDDFRSGCRNVSQCHLKQSFSGLHSPGRSQFTELTLMMTSAQVVETSVNVTSNSPSQDYTHLDDHNLPNYDMTPGFKPFSDLQFKISCQLSTPSSKTSHSGGEKQKKIIIMNKQKP